MAERSIRTPLALTGVAGDAETLRRVLETPEAARAEAVSVSARARTAPRCTGTSPRALGGERRPAFWVPGAADAPVGECLREAFDVEIAHPQL